jgi:hypothetical protein
VKWLPPDGSVQWTADKRYHVQRATNGYWIAYSMSAFGTDAEKLGEHNDDEAARECCETHEVFRKRA